MNIFSNGINYADGETPTVMSANIEAIGYEGWYYKNSALNKKISWYIPLGNTPLLVSDLTMIYTSLRILNIASLPFITIYTAPTGINDAGSWYHSKTIFSVSSIINKNANYCFYAELGSSVNEIAIDGHTNIKMTIDTILSSGEFTSTDVIKYISFCTSDDAPAGSAEFILSDINLLKPSGNVEFFLSNDELFSSVNVNIDSLVLSTTDNRAPGNTPDYAFLNPFSVTKVSKSEGGKLDIGHNGLLNDTLLNNFKLPRLSNVAGKGDSSIAVDNVNTLFNNFYSTIDFSITTNKPNSQFTVEAWGLDCATRTKVFVNENGDIKIMYRGVGLFSNGNVLPGDIILDSSSNPTMYGWTTHTFPGSLIPGSWYRLIQTIHFSENLYGDQVQTRLYELDGEDGNVIDITLWDVLDNTWEAFYVNHPSQASNGNMAPSVDSIQIHCCDTPLNTEVASIKNITYSTSKTVQVSSIEDLLPSSKGIITFLAGNSTERSIAAITGLQYVFEASGGYRMERGFNKIAFRTQDLIQRFDVTNAVQVKLDAGLFNTKLGLVKDVSNLNILTSEFNKVSDSFPSDSITISPSDFVNGMSASNIISVGKYSTMYSDFISYVRKYFGYTGGFSSLFQAASEFDISGGVFNADSFMALISQGKQIIANDVNVTDTAPTLYSKLSSSNGKMYEEVAGDYTGTIGSKASLSTTVQKWGPGSFKCLNDNIPTEGAVIFDRWIVPGATGMTFSFWANFQVNDTNQNFNFLSLGGVFNMAIRGIYLMFPYINCTNGAFSTTLNYFYGFRCNTWNYISLTIDPAGVWKYYLNGAFKQSISIAAGNSYGYPSTTAALKLSIGGVFGNYNEFVYYDRILSTAEIANLYSKYTFNNGTSISSWVKFSSLDATPRTVWSFYDTIAKHTTSLSATNTKYMIKQASASEFKLNYTNITGTSNTATTTSLVYPATSLNGVYQFSASSESRSYWEGFGGSGGWRTYLSATGPYTTVPYSGGNYVGGGSPSVFFTTVIDGQTISGEWWQIKFPVAIPITKYGLGQAGGLASIYPNTWYAAGSNNGTTWTQIDYRTNQTYLNAHDYAGGSNYTTSSSVPFMYIRFVFTKSNAVNLAVIWSQFFTSLDSSIISNINVAPSTNAWTHVASVFDNGNKLNNTWTTYINNVAYKNVADATGIDFPYIDFSNTINAIGMDASSGLNKMHGYIDDVVIYKSILTPGKVASLYNGYDTINKVADYTFDTNSLTNYSLANYATGSAVYDASITNLSLMTISGEKLGTACLYFPSKTYTGAVTLGQMIFPDQNYFSFSSWAKFASLDNSGSISTILSMYNTNTQSSISLTATASKYTLSVKNKKAPIFIEALPVQNNDIGASTTVSNLSYPYCRNGVYKVTTSSTGFTAGNTPWSYFNTSGIGISTGAVYSSTTGLYTGTNNVYISSISDPSNIPTGISQLTGIKFSPEYIAFNTTHTNIYGLRITADGQRLVYIVSGGYMYYATYNNTTNAWNTPIQTLEPTNRGYYDLAMTSDGSRCVVSYGGYIFFCSWNGTNYSALTQTLNTDSQFYTISITSDGSRISSYRDGYMKPKFAVWNGTNYSTFTDTLDIGSSLVTTALSADGSRIVYMSYNNVYWAEWNGTNYGARIALSNAAIAPISGNLRRLAISSDKSKIFISKIYRDTTNYAYSVFDPATNNYGIFINLSFPYSGINNSWVLSYREPTPSSFELYTCLTTSTNVYKLTGTTSGYTISGEHMQIELPYSLNLTQYYLNSYFINQAPRAFYVMGSSDGTNWDLIDYKTNVTIADNGYIYGRGIQYYVNTNTKYHRSFRLIIAQNRAGTNVTIFNMRISGFVQESIDFSMNCAVAPVIDEWNHVAGTISNNGLNSTVNMYINNTPYTFTTDPSSILYPIISVDTSYNKIAIGMDASSSSLNKMCGYIDDIKIYNSVLSASQISSLNNNLSITDTTVGKYNFNTETVVNGQIANYSSGSPVYDATITNTSLITSTGQRSGSGALYFPSTSYTGAVRIGNFSYDTSINVVRNGALWNYKFDVSQNAGGYIYDTTSGSYKLNNINWTTINTISSAQTAVVGGKSLKANAGTTAVYYGGNAIYTIPKTSGMTFAFWIYIDPNVSNNGKGVIGIANATGTGVISVKISGTTTYNLSLQTVFGGSTTTNIPSATIAPSSWNYVCWTISTAGVWKYYINGALQQTISANVKPYFSATHLYAASAYGATGFYGYLDEYRYYERALSDAEISSQYNYYTISPGAKVTNDLSGSITINNINSLLRNAVDANVFGNRTPNVGTGIASDPSYNSNYGVGDGFLDGDIIWVPSGTTIKLSVGIDAESFLPLNNIGPATSATFMAAQDTNFGSGNFTQATTASTTKISRTLQAPLMIRISNLQ